VYKNSRVNSLGEPLKEVHIIVIHTIMAMIAIFPQWQAKGNTHTSCV